MLQFNPYLRSSTRELIKDPYFDDIRIPENENRAPTKINLEIDEDGCFDYENGETLKYNLKDYLFFICDEIKQIHEHRMSTLYNSKESFSLSSPVKKWLLSL